MTVHTTNGRPELSRRASSENQAATGTAYPPLQYFVFGQAASSFLR
jgi:hypothetical protein